MVWVSYSRGSEEWGIVEKTRQEEKGTADLSNGMPDGGQGARRSNCNYCKKRRIDKKKARATRK